MILLAAFLPICHLFRAPAATHQSQNPTTVQITIHQPKHTLSNATAGSERLVTNTPHTTPSGHYGTQQTQGAPPATGQPSQSLQRLVISQNASGVIQQNRSTGESRNMFILSHLRVVFVCKLVTLTVNDIKCYIIYVTQLLIGWDIAVI